MGLPEEGREKGRKLIQINNGWKSPQSREGNYSWDPGSPMISNMMNKRVYNERNYNRNLKVKDSFESSKRKVSCRVQGNIHKAISEFPSRNFAVQKKWDDNIKSAEMKKKILPNNNNAISCKTLLQNWEIKLS